MFDDFYSWEEVERAIIALHILAICGCVTLVAYWQRNRRMLWIGYMGSLLGWLIPQRHFSETRTVNASGEGFKFYTLDWRIDHLLMWGVIGASMGCLVVYLRAYFRLQEKLPMEEPEH